MKVYKFIKTRKLAILILSLLFVSVNSFSQDGESDESYYIALYTLGDSWDTEKQPQEQMYFKEHSSFLSKLRKEKRISLGARYSDTGMLVIKAKSQEEAEALLHADVAIRNKLFQLEIHPFAPFYKGCIE